MSLWEVYYRVSHPLILPLLEISWRGLRVDLPKRAEAVRTYEAQVTHLRTAIQQGAKLLLDPDSPKQLMDWVYAHHTLKPIYRLRKNPRERSPSLDEAAIQELLTRALPEQVRQVLQLLLQYRAAQKVLSTYLKAPLDLDGRLRCGYHITGTETGRLSSSETVYRTGTNLQNIPPGDARRLIIPDAGMVFLSADLSQAEARVVAFLAGEQRLIDVFEAHGDIHRRNAAMIFRCTEDDVQLKQRTLAKRIVHASNYGMGPHKFAQVAGIQKGEAAQLLERYHALYPRIRVWHLQIQEQLKRTAMLTTPLGRQRQFCSARGDDLYREAYAYIPQSTVSDILNLGLIDYAHHGPGEILLQLHDSILIQVYVNQVADAREALIKHLTRPLSINGRLCTIPVVISEGATWDDLH